MIIHIGLHNFVFSVCYVCVSGMQILTGKQRSLKRGYLFFWGQNAGHMPHDTFGKIGLLDEQFHTSM